MPVELSPWVVVLCCLVSLVAGVVLGIVVGAWETRRLYKDQLICFMRSQEERIKARK